MAFITYFNDFDPLKNLKNSYRRAKNWSNPFNDLCWDMASGRYEELPLDIIIAMSNRIAEEFSKDGCAMNKAFLEFSEKVGIKDINFSKLPPEVTLLTYKPDVNKWGVFEWQI